MAEQEIISYTDLEDYESGKYRVTFENRTAWNAELIVEMSDDEDSHHVAGAQLFWFDPKDEKRNRVFSLEENENGDVICDEKPTWGRMTKLVARD